MGIAANLMHIGIKLIVMDCQQNYIHQSDHIYKDNDSSFQPIDDQKVKRLIKINQKP